MAGESMEQPKKKSFFARSTVFVMQVALLAGFIALFSYAVMKQVAPLREVNAEIALVEADITREDAIREDLSRQADYIGSDAYIEKIARERLRMIKKDEIVYVIDRR